MVRKKLPYDTNGLPYDVYMGDPRPQCSYGHFIFDILKVAIKTIFRYGLLKIKTVSTYTLTI